MAAPKRVGVLSESDDEDEVGNRESGEGQSKDGYGEGFLLYTMELPSLPGHAHAHGIFRG